MKTLLAALLTALPLAAFAQAWPTKPVKIIVPYPPGGAVDVSASVKAYLALKAVGQAADAEPMRRARKAIARAGGMDAVTIIDPPPPPEPAPPPDPGPAPPPLIPKLLVVERIGAAGKLRDARATLKIGRPDDELSDAELLLRERWEAASTIAQDDAQLRGFLATLDLDPDQILAP